MMIMAIPTKELWRPSQNAARSVPENPTSIRGHDTRMSCIEQLGAGYTGLGTSPASAKVGTRAILLTEPQPITRVRDIA